MLSSPLRNLTRTQVAPHTLAAMLLPVALLSCGPSEKAVEAAPPAAAQASSPEPPGDDGTAVAAFEPLGSLLAATLSPQAAAEPGVEPLLEQAAAGSRQGPAWPFYAYLGAEVRRLRGESQAAREAFRDLAAWAAADPYGDTWGASALAPLALWRWLAELVAAETLSPAEARQALEVAEEIVETRLFRQLVTSGLLPALPQVEEEVARLRAHLAWKLEDREAATRYFFDYLEVASTPVLDDTDQALRQAVIDAGLATAERLDLFRATRLLSLVRTARHQDEAFALLEQALEARNPQVRAEARYHLAFEKRRRSDRAEVIAWLDAALAELVDRELEQRALYLRGWVKNRSGEQRDEAGFRRDLEELVARYPAGRQSDNALNLLASEHLFAVAPEAAEELYAQLRRFAGENDYQDSAAFMPALGLFARGNPADLERADRLLAEYVDAYPEGPFRRRSIFWRGRIAEARGDAEAAQRLFADIVAESPFGYDGIRARMHLEEGPAARRRLSPAAGSQVRSDLRAAYLASRVDPAVATHSVYHHRVREAVAAGLWATVVGSEAELHRRQTRDAPEAPLRRLDDVPLTALDSTGLLPSLGLLVALRLDAEAARDTTRAVADRLQLAAAVGHRAGDWPLALDLASLGLTEPRAQHAQLMTDPRYLATAYPSVFAEPIVQAAARYPRVPPELLYSVARQESRFYPAAISRFGALGLYQFLSSTFAGLDRDWGVLEASKVTDPTTFLLDPERSIDLWARWVHERLLERNHGDVLAALIDHHAGRRYLLRWRPYWQTVERQDDVEFVVETLRFPATRVFVRQVLVDLWIAQAAGFLTRS